jgi:hypothetical protein
MTKGEMKKLSDEKSSKIEEGLDENIGYILILRDFANGLTIYNANMNSEFLIETLRETVKSLEERN